MVLKHGHTHPYELPEAIRSLKNQTKVFHLQEGERNYTGDLQFTVEKISEAAAEAPVLREPIPTTKARTPAHATPNVVNEPPAAIESSKCSSNQPAICQKRTIQRPRYTTKNLNT
jgi:hypothetical protein